MLMLKYCRENCFIFLLVWLTLKASLNATHVQECPIGTYKDVEGSNASLCTPCSLDLLPIRASFLYIRGKNK